MLQCEGIVEEHEDSIISLFSRKESNAKEQLCTNVAQLCDPADFSHDNDEDFEKDDTDEEHDEL